MSRAMAEILLEKARGNLNVAILLAGEDPTLAGVKHAIGYNLQQAVEKSAKALLAWNKIQYRLTHEIEGLLRSISARLLPVPERFLPLQVLTPFAEGARYEVDSPDEEIDRQECLALATEFMEWIVSSLSR